MSRTIFQNIPLVKPSFFQKLFKQLPIENSIIELNNLLAKHPVKEISKHHIYEIEQRYQITLEQEFKLNLEEFYVVYLNHFLTDKSFDNKDKDDLNHLKCILSLDENTIKKLHYKVGSIVYRNYFEKSIANGKLARKEQDFLEKLEKDLNLPKVLVNKISSETCGAFVQKYVENVIQNHKLSPSEEKEIENIAVSLNVNLDTQLNDQIKRQLKQLKLYWVLENIPLPTIEPEIVVQKSEDCYFKINSVNWYELRSIREKPTYYNSNSRILKEFYLKPNTYKSMNHSSDNMKYIDNGSLYLTNKRIIFIGSTKNLNIRFEKILKLSPKSDGIEIDKETGKVVVIQLPERIDEFSLILERLIKNR